jgi:NhaA family Na+:H+ antiporter
MSPSPAHGGPLDAPVRRTWSESHRFVPRRFVRPMQRFMQVEAAGGVVMLVAALLALAWANSPWHEAYETLWETPLLLELGDLAHLDLSLRDWVNDALMALFFFLAGLEIKRALVTGELRDPKAAALPAIAALGGMIVPALIYTGFNAGQPGSGGWGIPMATDIAFAVGVVSLLGSRVPSGAKLFLLTLAIVDDLGAILVIAVFYTTSFSFTWLLLAAAAVVVAAVITRLDVRSVVPYLTLGAFCWFALHESGVHATIAGVAFGLLTPTQPFHDPRRFGERARALVAEVEAGYADGTLTSGEMEEEQATLRDVVRLAEETNSPLDRVEHKLAPWVGFLIVPLFAFANAGVRISGGEGPGASRVMVGVAVGLVVGKTIGVFGFTWLATALRVGRLPRATTWRHMFGLAVTAGIGFTVALFVTGLAFDDPALADAAKVGILGASAVAGVLGFLLLRAVPPAAEDEAVRAGPAADVAAPR